VQRTGGAEKPTRPAAPDAVTAAVGEPERGFTEQEYVYKNDVEFRKELQERLSPEALQGLCVAWTLDWLQRNLVHAPYSAIYTPGQIAQLIGKQKAYIAGGGDLEKYGAGEGLSLRQVGSGSIGYWSGLEGFNEFELVPGCAYLVEMSESIRPGGVTAGHVFGLFRDGNAVLFFDQNFGMVRVADINRISEVYPEEIRLFKDELGLKFKDWAIFQLTGKG
jgi:hypothetical protein